MRRLQEISANVSKLNQEKIIQELIEKNSKWILFSNQVRLLTKGTNVEGEKIKTYSHGSGVYSPYTEVIKKEKGQPTDRVTIKDSGDAYSTMTVDAGDSSYSISMDTNKPDGDIEDNLDVEAALGQDEEGKDKLRDIMLPDMREILLTTILS